MLETSFTIIRLGFENIEPIGLAREKEKRTRELAHASGANTKQNLSPVNINIFLEEHVPPTRIPSLTDGERRECDGDGCIRARYMTRERKRDAASRRAREAGEKESCSEEKCPKWLSVQVTRGGGTHVHAHAAPSFTRGTHASRSYETRTRRSGANGTRYPYSTPRRRISSGSSITIANASYEIVARFKPSR